jgi:hypothetical protein
LSTDVGNQTVTVGASSEIVDYFDTVMISTGNGSISETLLGKDASGNTTYTTTTHEPDGTIAAVTSTTQPAATPDTLQFRRRWVIEKDSPVIGVRRITVAVLLTSPAGPNVNFRMSMVRP